MKLGGGEPQPVGVPGAQEQRPSPPASRAASMAATIRSPRSPFVARKAASQSSTTFAPVSTFPWIAYS